MSFLVLGKLLNGTVENFGKLGQELGGRSGLEM